MPLEPNFRWVDDLDPANPFDDDPVAQGDDHLRGIKNALQGSVSGDGSQSALVVGGFSHVIGNQFGLVVKRDGSGGGASPLISMEDDTDAHATIQANPGFALTIASLMEGQPILLDTFNAGVAQRAAAFNPGGSFVFNFDGLPRLSGTANGVDFIESLRVEQAVSSNDSVDHVVLNDVAGMRMRLSNTGQLSLSQLDAGGAFEGFFYTFGRNGGFSLYNAGAVQLDSQSGNTLRVRGDAAFTTLHLSDETGAVTRGRMVCTPLGTAIFEAAAEVELQRLGTDTVLRSINTGAVQLMFQNAPAAETNDAGVLMRSQVGSSRVRLLFWDQAAQRAQISHDGNVFYLTSDGAGDTIRGEAGGNRLFDFGPGGFTLSRGNVAYLAATAADRVILAQNLSLRDVGFAGGDLGVWSAGAAGSNLGNGGSANVDAVLNIRAGNGSEIGIQLEGSPERRTVLYAGNAARLRTVVTGNTKNSGSETIDGTGTFQPIGFNVLPDGLLSGTTISIAEAHTGVKRRMTTGVNSLQIVTASIPADFTGIYLNDSAGPINVVLSGGATSLVWFNGVIQTTGNRVLARGGVCTIARRGATTSFDIWGVGLT